MDDSQEQKQGNGSGGDKPQPEAGAPHRIEPSPALIEFAKATVDEPPLADGRISRQVERVDGMPISRELLRNRREWAQILEEHHSKGGGDSHMGKEPESKAPPDQDPPQR